MYVGVERGWRCRLHGMVISLVIEEGAAGKDVVAVRNEATPDGFWLGGGWMLTSGSGVMCKCCLDTEVGQVHSGSHRYV